MKRIFACIAFFTCLFFSLFSQELIQPDKSSEAIFEAEIGDADVEFFLTGSWNISLFGSAGILFGPDGVAVSAFPGLGVSQPFKQIPDLTFSVWLMERYFIEASVIGDFFSEDFDYFTENYFRMGYEGKEDEFLKHIYLGNRDISMIQYPFLNISGPGNSSLGVQALLGSGFSDHHLLLRYDNNAADKLVYIGKNLVTEEIIPLEEYIQGRFFKLPDCGVGNLEVYLEDPGGDYAGNDGRTYRMAELENAVLDSSGGTVYLKEQAQGRVLVYYTKQGLEIGDMGLGIGALAAESDGKINPGGTAVDFNWSVTYLSRLMTERQIDVNGLKALRLWDRGEFSPFEILNSYQFTDTPPDDLSLVRVSVIEKGKEEEEILSPAKFRVTSGSQLFTAYITSDLRGSFRNIYPFLDTFEPAVIFDPDNLIYGPEASSNPGYLDHEILVSLLTPISEYSLGENITPGSVRVVRNGMEKTRFEMDYETGVLTFLTAIYPDDRVEIYFRRKEALLNNGDLLFAWGNSFALSESMSLELATGLRWNALPGSYAEEAYSRTGTVIGSAALKGNYEFLSFEVKGGLAYTNPDTTGVMRLLSMEGTGLDIMLSEDTAYPARKPDDFSFAGSAAGRGELFYKDYRTYRFTGSSALMSYTWIPPEEQVFTYTTGSKPGPYLAAGSSRGTSVGQSLVLDFALDSNEWVGTQIPIYYGMGTADLSSFQSVSISYRAIDFIDVSGSFTIYLQIGEIGEDLDNDGLDEELSENACGFSFDDTDNGITLFVGSDPQHKGNGMRDTEDIDGNGFLDGETDDYDKNMVTITVGAIPAGTEDTGWITKTHQFSAGERAQLKKARSIRILAVEDSGSSCTGRVLIDRLSLAGSMFWAETSDTGGTIYVRQIRESEAVHAPNEYLEQVFPEVRDIFHSNGEEQKVLEICWDGINEADKGWTLKGYLPSETGSINYRTIKSYIRVSDPAEGISEELIFSLQDAQGRGIHWRFAPGFLPEWSQLEVSLDEKVVRLNGAFIEDAVVYLDPDCGSLTRFSMSLNNTASGTLYLDELFLTNPVSEVGGAFSLDACFSLPGNLVLIGNHALISDLSIKESAFFTTSGFSCLYSRPADVMQFNSLTELSFGLSLADLNMDFQIDMIDMIDTIDAVEDQISLSGGHKIRFPNITFPFILTDTFSLREKETGRNMLHSAGVQINILNALNSTVLADAHSREDILTQSWSLDMGFTPHPVFSFQAGINLQNCRSDFSLPVPEGGYLENWGYSYPLLLPRQEGEELERKGEFSFSLDAGSKPLGVSLTGNLGYCSFDFNDSYHRQRNELEIGFSFPFVLEIEGIQILTMTPGYRRSLNLLAIEDDLGDFLMDMEYYFMQISGQQYWYNQIPYAELFSSETESIFLTQSQRLEQAAYTVESSIEMSRSFSSRISDIFIPSYLRFIVEKEFKREGILHDLVSSYKMTAQNTALNLFGDYGAYPLFHFYKTDEISTSLTVELTADLNALREWEIIYENYFSFEDQTGNILTIENRFNIKNAEMWSDGLGLLFTWFRYPQGGVKLPYLSKYISEDGFWSHEESVELCFNSRKASTHPLNLLVSHETSLILPGYGRFRAELALGLDTEKTADNNRYWHLGIRGGIELKLEF